MKKCLLSLFMLLCIVSCKKEKSTQPSTSTNTNTNKYMSLTVDAPDTIFMVAHTDINTSPTNITPPSFTAKDKDGKNINDRVKVRMWSNNDLGIDAYSNIDTAFNYKQRHDNHPLDRFWGYQFIDYSLYDPVYDSTINKRVVVKLVADTALPIVDQIVYFDLILSYSENTIGIYSDKIKGSVPYRIRIYPNNTATLDALAFNLDSDYALGTNTYSNKAFFCKIIPYDMVFEQYYAFQCDMYMNKKTKKDLIYFEDDLEYDRISLGIKIKLNAAKNKIIYVEYDPTAEPGGSLLSPNIRFEHYDDGQIYHKSCVSSYTISKVYL